MSGGGIEGEPVVRSAAPVADLGALDRALAGSDADVAAVLKKIRPADVGRDLARRSAAESKRIVEATDDRRAAQILRASHPSIAATAIAGCKVEHATRLLSFLPTDHRVSILGFLAPNDRNHIEDALSQGEKSDVQRILNYPPNAVARLMSPKVWKAERGATAGEAMAILRDKGIGIEVAQNLYVVADDHLVGVAPLREVAIADAATPIADLMTGDPIAVSETTPRGDAAEIIQIHDFLSLPVIDPQGKLVGAVRVDDLLGAALTNAGKDLLNQAAVVGDIAGRVPYFQTSMVKVVRSRITWLVLLFVAETATGTVLRHFEDELAKVVALSFFIPLLIGTGGNAGSQTVSTVIRALALGEARVSDAPRVLAKEMATGALLGFSLGIIAFGRALLWGVDVQLAACVGVTVFVVCTWANTVGSLIPLGAQRLGIDPTVVSAPLITTLVDASGLFLYLTIAKVMISALH